MRTFGLGLQLGMGNMVTRAASGGGGDPFSGYVVSLLHFDGVNGSTTHTDVMGIPWTAWGGPTITTADSKFGGACASFDGSNDFLYNVDDPPAFTFGSGEFCIELWVKFTTLAAQDAIISQWRDSTNQRSFFFYRNGSAIGANFTQDGLSGSVLTVTSPTSTVAVDTWYHIAVSRQNNTSPGFDTFRIFVDGVVEASTDVASGYTVFDSNEWVVIGDTRTGSSDYTGLMDEMRVTKGAARYTGAFTPPTAPFPDPA